MNRAKARRDLLRKVPPIGETQQDEEWLGGEAHVGPRYRRQNWLYVFRTMGAGFTALSLGLAFLGGLVLGSTVASLVARGDQE